MQAQGSVIQGGMMCNFIQIYQNEGTKGLWKASVWNRILHFQYTLLNCISSREFSSKTQICR